MIAPYFKNINLESAMLLNIIVTRTFIKTALNDFCHLVI